MEGCAIEGGQGRRGAGRQGPQRLDGNALGKPDLQGRSSHRLERKNWIPESFCTRLMARSFTPIKKKRGSGRSGRYKMHALQKAHKTLRAQDATTQSPSLTSTNISFGRERE